MDDQICSRWHGGDQVGLMMHHVTSVVRVGFGHDGTDLDVNWGERQQRNRGIKMNRNANGILVGERDAEATSGIAREKRCRTAAR